MTLPPTDPTLHGRRYDLDWLRVIAFGLLIFYHVGMFYVTWGWHVKSVHAGPAIEWLMTTVNPWRLALLFFISGVAIRFASDKAKGPFQLASSRAFRLGIPILLGIVVIVAPQTYFELRQAVIIEPNFASFYWQYLEFDLALDEAWGVTTPTWNHLWYVVYLFVYVLLLTPLLPLLRRAAWGRAGRLFSWIADKPWRLIVIIAAPFIAYEYLLTPHYPTTHALWGDWANHAHRLTIFIIGYFVAKNLHFWRGVDRALSVTLTAVIALWLLRNGIEWAWPSLRETVFKDPILTIFPALDVVYAWVAILCLLGLAQRFLNRPSKALTYLTNAAFCYYIVHQTIIVAVGYWLTEKYALGPVVEPVLVISATFLGCIVSYELFKHIPVLRIGFGIRKR